MRFTEEELSAIRSIGLKVQQVKSVTFTDEGIDLEVFNGQFIENTGQLPYGTHEELTSTRKVRY